jgi:hypothetical protein
VLGVICVRLLIPAQKDRSGLALKAARSQSQQTVLGYPGWLRSLLHHLNKGAVVIGVVELQVSEELIASAAKQREPKILRARLEEAARVGYLREARASGQQQLELADALAERQLFVEVDVDRRAPVEPWQRVGLPAGGQAGERHDPRQGERLFQRLHGERLWTQQIPMGVGI